MAFRVLRPDLSSEEMEVHILSTLEGALGKGEEENGAAPWSPNTQVHHEHARRRHIPSHTHTHTHRVLSFVVAAAKWLFTFSAGCFHLPALCCRPVMKGSVYGGGSSETRRFCSSEEHQRGAELLPFSLTRG